MLGAGFGLVLLQSLGHLLGVARQLLRAVGELCGALACRGVAAGHGVGHLPLLLRQLLRLVAQRLHRALERGALEHLGALLQLLPHLLLHLRQILAARCAPLAATAAAPPSHLVSCACSSGVSACCSICCASRSRCASALSSAPAALQLLLQRLRVAAAARRTWSCICCCSRASALACSALGRTSTGALRGCCARGLFDGCGSASAVRRRRARAPPRRCVGRAAFPSWRPLRRAATCRIAERARAVALLASVGTRSTSSRLSALCRQGELSVATTTTCSSSPGSSAACAELDGVSPFHCGVSGAPSDWVTAGKHDRPAAAASCGAATLDEAVVVRRRGPQRHVRIAQHDRVTRRRDDLHARRGIRENLESPTAPARRPPDRRRSRRSTSSVRSPARSAALKP